MPVIEEGPLKGTRAEIILNPLGIIGRMNPAQLFELEINFIGLYIREAMKKMNNEERKIELLEFYDRVNKEQAEFTRRFFNDVDEDELNDFFNDIINKGIPVHQGPFFNNINIFDLVDLYKFYGERLGVKPFKFEDVYNPIILGEMYMMRLKHEPSNKSSARSTNLNDLKDLPAKDKQYKEFKSLYPKTPIKLGEMETSNLSISNDIHAVRELMNSYATNPVDRMIMDRELLTGNPFDIDFELSGTKSKNTEIMEELFYALGIELKK